MQLNPTQPTTPKRLMYWRVLAIVVSFSHMWSTIGAFGGDTLWGKLVAGGMTLLIDLAIYEEVEYLLRARRTGSRISGFHPWFLGLAVVLSVALQAGSLWSHRPEEMPWLLQVVITAALAIFVPLWIIVAAVMEAEGAGLAEEAAAVRKELNDLRGKVPSLEAAKARLTVELQEVRQAAAGLLTRAQQAEAERDGERQALAELRALGDDVRAGLVQQREEARTEAAVARAQVDPLRAALAKEEAEAARLRAEAERQEEETAQARAEAARIREERARAVDMVAQLQAEAARQAEELARTRAELEQARASAALDPRALAHKMRDEGVSARSAARILGLSDSTVRGYLKTDMSA